MPELKRQLADYFDHVVERLDVEDIYEPRLEGSFVHPLIPRTPRRGLPGRLQHQVAALAILLTVGGVGLLVGKEVVGTSDQTSTVPANGKPVIDEFETPAGVRNPQGDYVKGRYSLIVEGIPFSFNVPASGWEPFGSGDLLISKSTRGPQDAEAMIFWAGYPDGTYADPCGDLANRPPISTAANVAAAVATGPGIEVVSGPSEVTVGGRAAHHVTVIVREDVGCDPGFFYNWKAQTGGALWVKTELGDKIDVWIVDVDSRVSGTTYAPVRLFIAAETHDPDANPTIEDEIQQIIESIRFD